MTKSKTSKKCYPFASPHENSSMHKAEMSSIPRSSNEEHRNNRENGSSRHYQNQNNDRNRRSASDKNKPIKKSDNSRTRDKHKRSNGKEKRRQRTNKNKKNLKRLRWECQRHIPFESEQALLPILLKHGQKERGMLNTRSESRIQSIQQSCKRHG